MAHPKRKVSSARRDKRRSHHHALVPQLAVCKTTGEVHQYHRAYMVDGDLYYKGKMVIEGKK
ncbi:50S ribosomal protein L32 [Bacteroidales bacterium OttesenSCG-928-L14]|nr:50S ribosomal protein L32 [Bacteroidales bacterium OttesenSCG-928-L14]